jgi:hypothetical protein
MLQVFFCMLEFGNPKKYGIKGKYWIDKVQFLNLFANK